MTAPTSGGPRQDDAPASVEQYGPLASRQHLLALKAIQRIETRERTPRIRDELRGKGKYVEHCVRRALEIALKSAEGKKQQAEQPNPLPEWQALHRQSIKAAGAVQEFLRLLTGDDTDAQAIVARLLGQSRLGRVDPQTLLADAKDDAATILRASKILRVYADDTKRRRADIAKQRQNPGEPAKIAFVLALARIWVFLTNAPPSMAADSEFKKFIVASWRDCADPELRREFIANDPFSESLLATMSAFEWSSYEDETDFFTRAIGSAAKTIRDEGIVRLPMQLQRPSWLY